MIVNVYENGGLNVAVSIGGIQGPSGASVIPTGIFYPLNSNPNGYLTGEPLFVMNSGSYLQTGQAGQFYPALGNPSGFLNGLNQIFFVGSGSPSGVINAQTSGQPYTDISGLGFWISTSTGNQNWVKFI